MEHQQPSWAAAADARAAAGREAAPAAAPSGAGERPLGPCAWVAAIQDSPHAVAQRRSIEDIFGAAAASAPAALRPSRAPVQPKSIGGLKLGARQAGQNLVWIGGERTPVETHWQVPLGSKPSRGQLIQAAAQAASALGKDIDKTVGERWNMKPGDFGNEACTYFDPLVVRCVGDYAGQPMELDYHFGSSFSGYVVRVHDPSAGIVRQTMNEKPEEIDRATQYGHVHDVAARPTGSILDTDGADAVTKLAGEGARWQCIGDNVNAVRDDTRIYTNESADGSVSPEVRYIDFPTLWKSWAATFDKDYGIGDRAVSLKLRQPNVKVTTKKAVEERVVASDMSTAMRHGIDVCVDEDKPAAQADLGVATVQALRFTIERGKVFDLERPLQDHVDDMVQRVRAIPELGFMEIGGCTGAKSFEFLCKRTGPQPPVLAGYAVAPVGPEIRYPLYREPRVAGRFSRVYAPPVESGEAAYLANMRSAYEYRLGKLADYVNQNFVTTGVPGLNVLIRAQLLVWGGTLDDELPDHEEYTGGDMDDEIRKVLDAAKPKAVTTDAADSSNEDEPAQQPEPRKGGKGGRGAKSSGKKSGKSKK